MQQLGLKSFDEILPALVNTYNKGNLVPFTGAGLSAPKIPTWYGFLKNLCGLAEIKFDEKRNYTSQDLIQLSDKVVTRLSREGKGVLVESIRESLGYATRKKPKATDHCIALAEIWWPLVLSTNYDRMFVDQYSKTHSSIDGPPITVFGRNQLDCHTLLSAFKSPLNTLYWAVQGYFGESCTGEDLQKELVVGYKQYRNATFNSLAFRSAFAEIFRSYSFLFVGSGLSEEYFRGLFGEITERHGNNPMPHFALFRKQDIEENKIDHYLMHTRFNIISVYYESEKDSYEGLVTTITKLKTAIEASRQKLWKFGFKTFEQSLRADNSRNAGLEISMSGISNPHKDECSVISAGLKGKPVLSHWGVDVIWQKFKNYNQHKFKNVQGTLWQYSGSDIFASAARRSNAKRSSRDNRDLRLICDAVIDILTYCNGKYKQINIMLLAAGDKRAFPPVFSLVQMVKGYKSFQQKNKLLSNVRIHVLDESVLFFLRRQPLEIEELLNSDEIRLNVQIQDENETERFQFFARPETTVADISGYCDIAAKNWNVRILPSPFSRHKIRPGSKQSLREAGLIAGSTIIYTRKTSR